MNETNLIEAKDLTIRHKSKVAVNHANIVVPRGAVTALLGRNGAGKSSFLDACLGLIPPTSGSLKVLGMTPPEHGPLIRRRTGYVEADSFMEGHERVGDLLAMSADMHPETNMAFRDELAMNLKLSMRSKARSLSRGQRMKVALCMALAHRPELLILDEPFDGLDVGARHEILTEIIHQVDETRGIVIASHDLDEVERVADRVVILNEGADVISGSLDEVRSSMRRWSGLADPVASETLRNAGFSVETRGKEIVVSSIDKNAPDVRDLIGCEDLHPIPTTSLEDIFIISTSEQFGGNR